MDQEDKEAGSDLLGRLSLIYRLLKNLRQFLSLMGVQETLCKSNRAPKFLTKRATISVFKTTLFQFRIVKRFVLKIVSINLKINPQLSNNLLVVYETVNNKHILRLNLHHHSVDRKVHLFSTANLNHILLGRSIRKLQLDNRESICMAKKRMHWA